MDAERRGGEMTDQALDRELQSILAVDPSPEFVARVRTRIASEPQRSAAWSMWMFAAAAAAVVAIAVVVSRGVPREGAAASKPLASRVLTPMAFVVSDINRRPMLSHALPGPSPRAASLAATAMPQRAPDEILVDPREAAAIRALIRRVRTGGIDLAPVLNASTPTAMELAPVVEISIPDIAIDPIAPAPGAEGVQQ